MSNRNLKIGDLVKLTTEEWNGFVGIVTQPITEDSAGHVLVEKAGYILGIRVSIGDVLPADKSSQGFAQLAYNLIKLGSHVIEKRLI
jgi:hypothetical protein